MNLIVEIKLFNKVNQNETNFPRLYVYSTIEKWFYTSKVVRKMYTSKLNISKKFSKFCNTSWCGADRLACSPYSFSYSVIIPYIDFQLICGFPLPLTLNYSAIIPYDDVELF
jgi:hypothetical protein